MRARAGALAVALASCAVALGWPAPASAQVSELCSALNPAGCRPLCVSGHDPGYGAMPPSDTPAYLLSTASEGGTGTFDATARNGYRGALYNPFRGQQECATANGDGTWTVKQRCTLHCEHRHWTFTDTNGVLVGMPQPSLARVTATPDTGLALLGWTEASGCAPPTDVGVPRDRCAQVRMDQDRTVTARFGDEPDVTPPVAPASLRVTKRLRYQLRYAFTPGSDETWLGGYEVFVDGLVRTRFPARNPNGTPRTTFALAGLLCNRRYRVRIAAFDASQSATSGTVAAHTGACKKVPPNGVFHVRPPQRTSMRSAYFHWGAVRGGTELRTFKSRCRLDAGAWGKCSSLRGKTVRSLAPGWHVFRVRVGDAQGWDPRPARWRWLVRG